MFIILVIKKHFGWKMTILEMGKRLRNFEKHKYIEAIATSHRQTLFAAALSKY